MWGQNFTFTGDVSPYRYFLNNPRKITQMKLAFNLELGNFYKKHIRSRESFPLPICLKLSPKNHMKFKEGYISPSRLPICLKLSPKNHMKFKEGYISPSRLPIFLNPRKITQM